MNRINEMIREFCPNGIKTVPLWKYTAWDKKFNAVDNSMQKASSNINISLLINLMK